MLTIRVKTIVNASNNILPIKYGDTNINTFATVLFVVYFSTFSNVHFFSRLAINEVNGKIVVKKCQNYHGLWFTITWC